MSLILPDNARTAPKKDPLEGLSAEEQAVLEQSAQRIDPTAAWPSVQVAFAVIIDNDGQVAIDPSLVTGVNPRRAPHNADVVGALHNLLHEMETNTTALKAASAIQQQAMAMQKQAQDQMLARQVQNSLGKR